MTTLRQKISVSGQVQGVGFRPFIFKLATESGLTGFVGNNSQGVFIEIQGTQHQIETFHDRFESELPPLARIESVSIEEIGPSHEEFFEIHHSADSGARTADISPDYTTCKDCLEEIFDPGNRRYRYPFTNCTNCGPRYSIIRGIPYDRPKTTMADFKMCPNCQAEYDDPLNRRFHAQPNACPVCGPTLQLVDSYGNPVAGDPIEQSVSLLKSGSIIAIKGLGGFHLACLATDEAVVQRLRQRKNREAKPLAIMVASLEDARTIADIDGKCAELMTHRARPIVLVPRINSSSVADSVAPGTTDLGIMLPYTPLHHLLLHDIRVPLVMTSGNPTDEPLSVTNDEALDRLGSIADAFLLHNRGIEHSIDDSVIMPVTLAGKTDYTTIRRARGFAPEPIILKRKSEKQVLALGGELKSTICLLKHNKAIVSEHLGELANPASFRNFVNKTSDFLNFFEGNPEIIAADMHPNYGSGRHAPGFDLPVKKIQHHHAHIASCMAENDYWDPVIGIAADGTGYGTDGSIWGCELLIADTEEFQRAGHLLPFPLPGGDSAAKNTWRPALGLIAKLMPESFDAVVEMLFMDIDQEELSLNKQMVFSPRTPITSSLGRLFDAFAFLTGVCTRNRYEAEAAMKLEQLARQISDPYTVDTEFVIHPDTDLLQLDPSPLLDHLFENSNFNHASLAATFHQYLADSFVEAALLLREQHNINTVALSGGCFLNRVLLSSVHQLLLDQGFKVLTHRLVPPGDGGISLGQAVIACNMIDND